MTKGRYLGPSEGACRDSADLVVRANVSFVQTQRSLMSFSASTECRTSYLANVARASSGPVGGRAFGLHNVFCSNDHGREGDAMSR